MELIRGLHNLRPHHRNCVVTIGNFDGMHLGHQSLLMELQELSRRHALPSAAILFEPQPREFFQGKTAPARLTRLREKLTLLARTDLNRVLCLRFDEALAAMPAEVFVRRVLIEGVGAGAVLIGDDFRFGHDRTGDLALLGRMGARGGFEARQAASFAFEGGRVSSSRVREVLAAGDMEAARRLLGRYYSMEGRVVHGEKRGRDIGYPTMNIDLHRRKSAIHGIFAARVHGLGAQPHSGMAYVGNRPAFGGTETLLEVHLFDFDRHCYGAHVRVECVRKLREDMWFGSFAELRAQLDLDAVNAKRALAEMG